MIPGDYQIYALLFSGRRVQTRCMGPSMEPVYSDGDPITIYPFTLLRPDPVVGDVVHFSTGRYFNRHQVADIFTASDGEVWYRLAMGDGSHDQFILREDIIGYVVPEALGVLGLEPKDVYRTAQVVHE